MLKKLTKKQITGVVKVILYGCVNTICDSLPPIVPAEDFLENDIKNMVKGAINLTGWQLSILYADITNDGIGADEALEIINWDGFIDNFVINAIEDGGRKEFNYPNIDIFVNKFVNFISENR